MLVEALADATFPIELPPTERHPNGEVIYPAAIHYVPAGGPDADTKPGVWVRFWDLCHEEVARIMAMHGWDRKLDNEPSS
jgi:hypothetical protein